MNGAVDRFPSWIKVTNQFMIIDNSNKTFHSIANRLFADRCMGYIFEGGGGGLTSAEIFFFNLLDQGPCCGATDCSCFGLRVSFLTGFKSRVDLLPAHFLACML